MEPPVKKLHVDDSSGEKEDCPEQVENEQTLENVLTYDELLIIFKYLNAKDLCMASCVCRSWRNAAQKEATSRFAPEYFLKSCEIKNEEKTKEDYDPTLIGEELRMIPDICLVCEKIQRKNEWVPAGCYCKNLPNKCATIIVGGYDIIADDKKIDKALGMAVSAFIPQIPKLNRKVYGELRYSCNGALSENLMKKDAIEMLKSLLPSKSGESKCIIMLTSNDGYNFTNIMMEHLHKSYKPGTISLWGGVCIDLKSCGNSAKTCSEPIRWIAITLSSPSLKTWSLVLPRKCRSEAQMEEKLQHLKKNIKLRKHCLGLMFACCERISRKEAEMTVFKKVFPDIPLIGLHGDGEYGLNTLNEKRENQVQHAYSTIFLILTYQ